MTHDAGPPARAGAATLVTWIVASLLAFGAIVSTVWVLSQEDAGPADAGPAPSASAPEPAGTGVAKVSARPSPRSSPSPSPTPSPVPPPVVAVQGGGSGRCVDVPDAAIEDGATLQVYDCNESVAQQWTITPSGELRVGGTKCLDDPSGGENAVAVAIYECHGGDNQRWTTPGDGTIRSVATGLCLDVEAAGTENGSRIQMYECHLGPNQLWTVG